MTGKTALITIGKKLGLSATMLGWCSAIIFTFLMLPSSRQRIGFHLMEISEFTPLEKFEGLMEELRQYISSPHGRCGSTARSGDALISIGCSTKWNQFGKVFSWKHLENRQNIVRQEHGLSFDHPYFFLHNEGRKEYVFCELAWPPNRIFEFDKVDGLTFSAGPSVPYPRPPLAPHRMHQ